MMYGIATWARCSLRKRSCQRNAKSAWRRACQPLPGRSEFSRLAKMQQCSIALQQHASCSMHHAACSSSSTLGGKGLSVLSLLLLGLPLALVLVG